MLEHAGYTVEALTVRKDEEVFKNISEYFNFYLFLFVWLHAHVRYMCMYVCVNFVYQELPILVLEKGSLSDLDLSY